MLVSGLVLGVQEVSDGSAKTAVDELQRVLEKIRQVAQELGIENSDKIGWHLVESLMSDQASTQKSFNKLVREKIRESQTTHSAGNAGKEIVEAFCGMHLGVHL